MLFMSDGPAFRTWARHSVIRLPRDLRDDSDIAVSDSDTLIDWDQQQHFAIQPWLYNALKRRRANFTLDLTRLEPDWHLIQKQLSFTT